MTCSACRKERMAILMSKQAAKHVHGAEAREKVVTELREKRVQRVENMIVCGNKNASENSRQRTQTFCLL
jgi:hypothetical protein